MGIFARLFGRWRRKAVHSSRREPGPHRSQRERTPTSRRTPGRGPRPGDAFTPTRPKAGRHLVGREAELSRITQALIDERAHVVLYSERGRGKTSLANLVTEALRRQDRIVARYTCETTSTFDTVVRGLARDLPASLLAASVDETEASEGCEAALPREPLRPRDVVTLPTRLTCRDLVCVIDEFDRIEDVATRTYFADTIKQVSDRGVGLSFVIVGVSENLEQILGQHPSIQRNIVAVHLPLLSDAEIAAMLTKGSADSGLVFASDVLAQITVIARGMPYMAQLLGLRVAQSALSRGEDAAEPRDLAVAVNRLVADGRQNVVAQYGRLTDEGRDHDMVIALRRVAMSEQDRWGRFVLEERADRVLIGGREIHAEHWAVLQEENVLRATAESASLVVFADRALLYHILLLASQAGTEPAAAASPVEPMAAMPRMRQKLAASNG